MKDGRYEINDGVFWYKNGVLHCEDGPAIDCQNGYREWIQNGIYHRIDGPAVEYANGDKQWWIHGVEYSERDFNILTEKIKLNEKLQQKIEEKPVTKKVKI